MEIIVTRVARGQLEKLSIFGNDYDTIDVTRRGTSALEIVNAFIKIMGADVPDEFVGSRPGDIAVCFADAGKAERAWMEG